MGVNAHLFLGISQEDLGRIAEDHTVPSFDGFAVLSPGGGQIIATHDDVLARTDDRLAVGRAENIVRGHHQDRGLDLGFYG